MTVGRTDDDNLEARGYHRIVDFPEHLAFGAAEGACDRFDPAHPIEIHSSPATLLFAYGIVGSAAFLLFLLNVVKRAPLYLVAHLLPVAFYSITHNGLRDSMFWILLAFLQCLAAELAAQQRQQRAATLTLTGREGLSRSGNGYGPGALVSPVAVGDLVAVSGTREPGA
jgi:hypothetical protein